jgi:hypothetical protein
VKTYTGESETTTTSTIDASITGALLGGANGYQAFRYQFLVNNPTWWTKMQQYAVPGCNWPRPRFTVAGNRLTGSFDPAQTIDVDQAANTLQVRFDYDGDRVFDTLWQSNVAATRLLRSPNAYVVTMQARDASGHVSTTRRRFLATSPLVVTPTTVSTTTGGQSQIQIDVGPAGAGNVYLAIASISGTSPGFQWQTGFQVPLNIDGVTTLLASDPNGGLLANGLGNLDAQGRATATLTIPPAALTFLAGLPIWWNFLCQTPAGAPACFSDSKQITLTL